MKIADLVSKIGFDVDAKPLDGVSSRLEDIKTRLSFLGAAEVVRGIFALSQSMSGFASDLLNASEVAGVSTASLQGLQFAATQAGASAQDMSGALGTLTKGLYDVRHGNEQAIESFKAVGFSPQQVAGFRTSSDAFKALADRISAIRDPIERQATANKLLGGSASALIPLLAKGSKGISDATDEAEKMGAVLGGKNIEALHQVEESLGALWQTLKVFSATVASYFAPGITAATKAVLQWYAAHRQLLSVTFKKWAENATFAFGLIYGAVEGLIYRYTEWANEHPRLASAVETVIEVLAAFSLGAIALSKVVSVLSSLFGVLQLAISPVTMVAKGAFTALSSLAALAVRGIIAVLFQLAVLTETAFPALSAALLSFAGVLEATPIGWIVTAIAALVLVMEAAYTMLFKGGSFKDTWLGKMYEGIKGAGGWILDKLGIGGPQIPKGQVPFREGMQEGNERPSIGPPAALARNEAPQPTASMFGSMFGMGSSSSAASQTAETPSVTNTVNAPVTINVPPGTPEAGVAAAVKDGIREHLEKVSRETRRSLRPSQAY